MRFVHHREELLLFGGNGAMRVVDLRSDKLKPAKHGWFTLDQAGLGAAAAGGQRDTFLGIPSITCFILIPHLYNL